MMIIDRIHVVSIATLFGMTNSRMRNTNGSTMIIRSVSPKRRSNSAFRFSAYRRTTSPMNSATGRYRNRCSMSIQ